MSIPTTREKGDIRLIDNLVGCCGDMEDADAWERIKADIATRELAIAERDKAREAFRGLEVEYDAALARAEAGAGMARPAGGEGGDGQAMES